MVTMQGAISIPMKTMAMMALCMGGSLISVARLFVPADKTRVSRFHEGGYSPLDRRAERSGEGP